MKLRYVKRVKDSHGNITQYILEDENEKLYTYSVPELKIEMEKGIVSSSDLYLDAIGRLRLRNRKINRKNKRIYVIMHGDRKVATIDARGHAKVYYKRFMPYNLYLDEENEEIDTLVNNINNFHYWCATRVLTLDRQYAKEILNSIGALQATTDKDRAGIALSYHCLTLTDIFWVKKYGEKVKFPDVNLYENHLENAFVDIALRGKQMTVQNSHLIADDISTNGCFPKAWLRKSNEFFLLKDGGQDVVEHEILASQVCRCFRCNQVKYDAYMFDGEKASISQIITNQQYSIVSREAFEIYAVNKEIDAIKYIIKLDGYSYYMMNILDYLVGNTDRHWGNWGFLINNENNKPIRLHDLMDFNQAFHCYENLEGANCQTTVNRQISQKDAAIDAVKKVGLNQICEIKKEWFQGNELYYEIFSQRLNLLKNYTTDKG